MAYWNHFSERKYKAISFSDVKIGEKFRTDKFKNKRRRKDIICIKTAYLAYEEQKSKQKYYVIDDNFDVSHYSELFTKTN